MVRLYQEIRLPNTLGREEKLIGELPRALHHASMAMRLPQSPQHGKDLGRVSQLLGELVGAAVDLLDFRTSWTHGGEQHWTKRNQHVQLLLDTFDAVWQIGEQLQSAPQVRASFHIGRTLHGSFPGLLPVGYGLYMLTSFRIVMCQ